MSIASLIKSARSSVKSVNINSMASKYLKALIAEAYARPERFVMEGAHVTTWAVFDGAEEDIAQLKKSQLVKAVARIAPPEVSISDAGTCICMRPAQ